MELANLSNYRCRCGKLLLKGMLFNGNLEIKCKSCGEINKIGTIEIENDESHYLLIVDRNGVITNNSTSACQILGYAPEELIGCSFKEIYPALPVEISSNIFGSESVLTEDNRFQLDTFHQTKEKKMIPVNVLIRLQGHSDNQGHLVVYANLNCEVRVSKNYLNEACDYYFDIDKNGVYEYLCPSAQKIFGISLEKAIGKSYFSTIPIRTIVERIQSFAYFSANQLPFRFVDDSRVNKDNKIIITEQYFTPRFKENGKFIGYRVLGWVKKVQDLLGTKET